MEPIQGEGGDHHFRPEFLQGDAGALPRARRAVRPRRGADRLRAHRHRVGLPAARLQPDVVAFGKKTQVCGVMAGGRVDEVPDNVFATSSRINSTWGGSLTDMVRARRILEVVETERLIDRAASLGPVLLGLLNGLAGKHEEVTDVRGRGLMCAFSLPTRAPARRRADVECGRMSGAPARLRQPAASASALP
jgi:L-lysine 6-transaminase